MLIKFYNLFYFYLVNNTKTLDIKIRLLIMKFVYFNKKVLVRFIFVTNILDLKQFFEAVIVIF